MNLENEVKAKERESEKLTSEQKRSEDLYNRNLESEQKILEEEKQKFALEKVRKN